MDIYFKVITADVNTSAVRSKVEAKVFDSELYTNAGRARLVRPYVKSFAETLYGKGLLGRDKDDTVTILADFIANLLHLAKALGLDDDDIDAIWEQASEHWVTEVNQEA